MGEPGVKVRGSFGALDPGFCRQWCLCLPAGIQVPPDPTVSHTPHASLCGPHAVLPSVSLQSSLPPWTGPALLAPVWHTVGPLCDPHSAVRGCSLSGPLQQWSSSAARQSSRGRDLRQNGSAVPHMSSLPGALMSRTQTSIFFPWEPCFQPARQRQTRPDVVAAIWLHRTRVCLCAHAHACAHGCACKPQCVQEYFLPGAGHKIGFRG